MINTDMQSYNYFLYGEEDRYGQPQLSDTIQGSIKMSIYPTSTSIQDNINYKNAEFVGLTKDSNISDKYVIQYGTDKLKVLYIIPEGRLKQVFLIKV